MVKPLFRTLTAAILAVVSSITAQANLLTSPADSDWTSGWTAGYGCSTTRDSAGERVLRQTLPESFTSGNHSWHRRLNAQAGASYRFSAQYKLEDVKKAMVQFHFVYPDGKFMTYQDFRFSTPLLSGTEDSWQELVYEYQVPQGAAAVELALRLDSPGTIYWKDVRLIKTSSSPSLSFEEDVQSYDLRDSVGIVVRELPVDKLLPLNAKWMRYNINWASVEKDGPGQWNQEYLDKVEADIAAAKAAGIHVMVSLGYPPRWAARKNEGVRGGFVVAKEPVAFGKYVAVVAGRLNHLVDCYRIMNEVNHQWDNGSQPQEYTIFLKEAYQTIKAIDPDATVLMAGVSGTPGGYLNAIFQAGGGAYFDVAACQPYMHGRATPEEGRLADRLRAYRMVLAENGSNKPIWATEYGYPSEPLDRITPEQQAAMSVRSQLLAISSGAGVTKFFFFLLRDQVGDTISQTGGLYTRDWELKPLGQAIQTLAKVINPVRRYVGEVDLGDDPTLYNRLFEVEPGEYVWALWQTEGETELSLNFPQPVEKVSWEGKTSTPSQSHSITLGELPVYFTGDMRDMAAQATKEKRIGYHSIDQITKNSQIIPWSTTMTAWDEVPVMELKAKRDVSNKTIAKAQVTASTQGLWCKVDIEDSSPALNTTEGFAAIWRQDSVEVFLNYTPENAPAGFVTDDCYHYIVSPGVHGTGARAYWASQGSRSMQQIVKGSNPKVTVWPDKSGYTISFFVPWKDGIAPKPGESIGFDILATRSNANGEREETAVWSGSLDNSTDASLWGVLNFASL